MLDANDPKLTAYVLGELDEAERAAVEASLADSAELRAAVETIRRTATRVEHYFTSESPVELAASHREAIEQAAASSGKRSKGADVERATDGSGWTRRRAALLALACSLLLVIGIGAWATWFAPWNSVSGWTAYRDQATHNGTEEPSAQSLELSRSQNQPDATSAPATQSETVGMDVDGAPYPTADLVLSPDGRFPRSSIPQHGGFDHRDGDSRYASGGGSRYASGGGSGSYSSPADIQDEFGEQLAPADDIPAPRIVTEIHAEPELAATLEAVTSSVSGTPATLDPIGGSRAGGMGGRGLGDSPTSTATGRNASQYPAQSGYAATSSGEGFETAGRRDFAARVQEAERLAEPGRDEADADGVLLGGEGLPSTRPPGKPATREPAGIKKDQPGPRTWRRAAATPNNSRLRIGDRDELPLEGIQANVVIDGFRARVLLDCYYFNDRSQQLEGSFQLRLPNEASLYYFAFGQSAFQYRPMVDQLASRGFLSADLVRASGTGPREILEARRDTWTDVKEARLVPPQKAAHAYGEVVRQRVDPALVEWAGAGVFNAKVYPLIPNKLHRIVIGYDVNLQQDGDDLVYRFDLPDDVRERLVDLDVSAAPGTQAEIKPATRPFISAGRAFYHFKNPESSTIEVRFEKPGHAMLVGHDDEAGDFFATRVVPPLDDEATESGSSHAMFLLDTSLSANPDKFNVWLELLEATLRENRAHLRQFAVLWFNVETHWWQDGYVENTKENVARLINDCQQLALEGATDLRAALAESASPAWQAADAPTPRADLFLLSDGAATWGELNVAQMTRLLQQAETGSLFAFQTGLSTDTPTLEQLAHATGGAVFTVNESEIEKAATAHRRRPWQLVNATIDGGNDLLIAGRPRSIFPGQSLLLVGRGTGVPEVVLQLRRGDERKTLAIPLDRTIESQLVPRLYGQVAVGQLETLADATQAIATAYARHFRVTGRSVSLLMLESEADYRRFDIKPEDDALVVQTTSAGEVVEQKLDEWHERLGDPKDRTLRWLRGLEKMPGMQFVIPPSLEPSLERLSPQAFVVTTAPLRCQQRTRAALPKEYAALLEQSPLDYRAVVDEAERRRRELGEADALKALSSLIEQQPGDAVLARDVAFTAIAWGLPAQAYPLLRRVAESRPYEPQAYQAVASCLAETGNADLAMIYYEVVLNGQWNDRYPDVQRIVAMEYMHLLRRIETGELSSEIPQYAAARLRSLAERHQPSAADLVVTMMWNTDRTDVDLHVVEPSGEVCSYQNRQTRSGGTITRDVTQGFGPEMYLLPTAPAGSYTIQANYYGGDADQTQVRAKVYVTIYENFGRSDARVSRRTVTLDRPNEKQEVATVVVKSQK